MANFIRRTRLTAVMCILAFVLVTLVAMSKTASAQGCCRTYSVLVQNSVPNVCFPLTVTTRWSNLLTGTTAHAGPGLVTLAAPNPPGCWQSPLVGLSINGVAVPAPFTGPVNLGGGCVVNIGLLSTATGCLTIVIF